MDDENKQTLQGINDIGKESCKVLFDSAMEVNAVKQCRGSRTPLSKKMTKPWFNSECRYKRKLFLKARKRSTLHKGNAFIQQERKKQAKEYKRCVKREFKKYQTKLAKNYDF